MVSLCSTHNVWLLSFTCSHPFQDSSLLQRGSGIEINTWDGMTDITWRTSCEYFCKQRVFYHGLLTILTRQEDPHQSEYSSCHLATIMMVKKIHFNSGACFGPHAIFFASISSANAVGCPSFAPWYTCILCNILFNPGSHYIGRIRRRFHAIQGFQSLDLSFSIW